MQKEMLKLLHIGHPGITKVKARARSTLYWPGIFKKTYLLVIDFTTNFFEISKLRNAESPTVVSHTKTIFARHRIPKQIVLDSGPEYTAKSYQKSKIKMKNGNTLRRNRQHILKANHLDYDSDSSYISLVSDGEPTPDDNDIPTPSSDDNSEGEETAAASDSDVTIPFTGSDDEQPTRSSGRILRAPQHIRYFVPIYTIYTTSHERTIYTCT